eukprot:1904484-Heterocapsa_arctica.AAC.1
MTRVTQTTAKLQPFNHSMVFNDRVSQSVLITYTYARSRYIRVHATFLNNNTYVRPRFALED